MSRKILAGAAGLTLAASGFMFAGAQAATSPRPEYKPSSQCGSAPVKQIDGSSQTSGGLIICVANTGAVEASGDAGTQKGRVLVSGDDKGPRPGYIGVTGDSNGAAPVGSCKGPGWDGANYTYSAPSTDPATIAGSCG